MNYPPIKTQRNRCLIWYQIWNDYRTRSAPLPRWNRLPPSGCCSHNKPQTHHNSYVIHGANSSTHYSTAYRITVVNSIPHLGQSRCQSTLAAAQWVTQCGIMQNKRMVVNQGGKNEDERNNIEPQTRASTVWHSCVSLLHVSWDLSKMFLQNLLLMTFILEHQTCPKWHWFLDTTGQIAKHVMAKNPVTNSSHPLY